jgi:hypothetical protein
MMFDGLMSRCSTCWRCNSLKRASDARADADHFLDGARRGVEQRQQRVPVDIFHDDVGLRREVADGEEFRHMRARKHGQDHLLHLEADDGGGVVAVENHRHFHDDGNVDVVARHAPQRRHAACVQLLADQKSVEDGAFDERLLGHGCSCRSQRPI